MLLQDFSTISQPSFDIVNTNIPHAVAPVDQYLYNKDNENANKIIAQLS